MLLTGISLLAGWDRNIQTALLQAFPQYGSGLTAIEEQEAVKNELDKLEGNSIKPETPNSIWTLP
jgi:hypothetical protein